MVQAVINLNEREARVLNIVKGKFGLKNKSEAINLIIDEYEQEFLELKLKPEFVKRLEKLEKQKGIPFKNIAELRKIIGE
ncbi:DUF2683 family protein [Candidatus Woesearchaeota archaeon]|nr:DUF2683 family protein [Candidatus Woesearchaeota archaeon]